MNSPAPASGPQVAIFGDSHTAALAQAREWPQRKDRYGGIRIVRVRKEKDGKTIGDSSLEQFCRRIADFRPSDFVFSAVGGNQYAVVSTVRHRREYDFLGSTLDRQVAPDGAELVPFRAIAAHIDRGVRGSVGPVLRKIRAATDAKIIHLAPPPPKQDNDFISRHFEKRFAGQGLKELGPARPELRLKCWKLQLESLRSLCDELGIQLMEPPARTLTPEGYLAPRCYAADVTHGNRRYGEYVLKDILKITKAHPTTDGARS
jgi:hypothetical protein